MSIRMKLLALVAVVACGVIAAPQLATAAKKKSHTIAGTAKVAILESSGNRNIAAGRFTGKPAGTAAVLSKNTITGSTIKGSVVLYAKTGTVNVKTTNKTQAQTDGSVKLPGTFKVTGGTGRYKGATGSGTFNGTLPKGGTVFTFKVAGKVRY
jgi:hypothetical protein